MLKILHIGKAGNLERYADEDSILRTMEVSEGAHGLTDEEYLKIGGDADFIIADAISPVSGNLIEKMPNLKLIHSEGVAFNAIDLEAAKNRGIPVCNSGGMNASAVAEITILLMLGMIKDFVENDAAVRDGRQIEIKSGYMQRGDLAELSDCSVGLVGFGDIATETAKLLRAFGVKEIYYNKRYRLSKSEEETLQVQYLDMDELLGASDIVSLHIPLNESTKGMVDAKFFDSMKDGSYFVNTARGELVDDDALIQALRSGKLKMAGLDTLSFEPVERDHKLLNLPDEISRKIIFSPHIGGITASSIRRSYAYISQDIEAVMQGRIPGRIVGGTGK